MPMIKGQTDDKVTTGFQHSMTSNKASNLPFAVFNDLSKLWTAAIAWSSKNNHTKIQLWPLTSFWIPLSFLKLKASTFIGALYIKIPLYESYPFWAFEGKVITEVDNFQEKDLVTPEEGEGEKGILKINLTVQRI